MPISTFEEARQRLIDSLKKPAAAAATAKPNAKNRSPAKAAATTGTAAGARKKKS